MSMFFVVVLSGCGTNPKHLDEHLATQLLTEALAKTQVTVAILASDPSAADLATPPPGYGVTADVNVDPNDPWVIKASASDENMNALAKAGYVLKRYQRVPGPSENPLLKGDVVATYVFTQTGKAASKTWKQEGPYGYTATLGTGYKISDVRNIRFAKRQGAYFATLDYDATPILSSLGRAMASAGDGNLAKHEHAATLLLMSDGWAVSDDGISK